MKTKHIECANYRRQLPSRRKAISIGALGALGGMIGLEDLLAAPGGNKARKTKSVILLFQFGGPSHLDTFDPKPDAPAEIRGEFKTIQSAIPGTFVSEHLPRLASLANRYSIIRSMSHDDTDHGSATYLTLTGRYHSRKSSNPPPSADDHPAFSAAMKQVLGPAKSIDNAITINGPAQVLQLPAPGQHDARRCAHGCRFGTASAHRSREVLRSIEISSPSARQVSIHPVPPRETSGSAMPFVGASAVTTEMLMSA